MQCWRLVQQTLQFGRNTRTQGKLIAAWNILKIQEFLEIQTNFGISHLLKVLPVRWKSFIVVKCGMFLVVSAISFLIQETEHNTHTYFSKADIT